MIPELRQDFNRRWTPELYARFLTELDRRSGTHVKFRNSETPCFFPRALLEKMALYGSEMLRQLLADASYLEAATAEIPKGFHVPGEAKTPLFVQADFGIGEDLEPKLVEIQGFPSLYAFQPVLGDTYRDVFGIDPSLRHQFRDDYWELTQRAIVGEQDPENVILLEIDPLLQKTLPDFNLTEKCFGIRTVNLRDVKQRGNKLFFGEVPIRRIYNRVIVDELQRKGISSPFDWRDDLDVEWAGHPNWYFKLSKFSIPYLKHPSVPKTWFLNELRVLPPDLDNYVLKPLYSFGGAGVVVGPTRERVEAIDRRNFILQERLRFRPVIDTPHGMTQAEVRIMYVWLDEDPVALTTIIRTGRGKMMGVDHNKNLQWVGATAGFFPV
ncbi:MAG TPA: hypothetical protein VHD76_09315 [Bryobacteraceae bacterium]|jgi:hypothetical protein|nr:hypothetical protein [Bryobacteraceae bacterium]